MATRYTYKHHSYRKFFLATSVLLAVVAATAIWYLGSRTTPTKPSAQTTKTTNPIGSENSTHTQQTSGENVTVPNNVPSQSVKDYKLIVDTPDYKIRELNGAYTITLYAIINNPSEADSYRQQLHQYKQEALNYLTQHGVDVNKVSITYDPPEAANY